MNAPMFSLICAHKGSSFGSNTTHCVPLNRLSSMQSAVRRTAILLVFICQLIRRREGCVAPYHPACDGKGAETVNAQGVQLAVLLVVQVHLQTSYTVDAGVNTGGDFHTPRLVSVCAMIPAILP